MSLRRIPFATGEYYHVYNRSIAKEIIFNNLTHLCRAIDAADYYRYPQTLKLSAFNKLSKHLKQEYLSSLKKYQPFVEIYAFTFMPNHFHFELQQLQDNGIEKFLTNFQNSYAKYYNTFQDRIGGLFQDRFKAKIIESNEEFIHVSRYIHLNPVTSSIISFDELSIYPYSSYMWYINTTTNRFINTNPILNHFRTLQRYTKFLRNNS